MSLSLEIEWLNPVPLRMSRDRPTDYSCDLDELFDDPGIYVFCRVWGGTLSPLYVGQATSVHTRVKQQLNNHRLMLGVYSASPQRPRCLMHGYLNKRPGQQLKKSLDIAERACMEYATSQGITLLNKQGIRRATHTLASVGNRKGRGIFKSEIAVAARQ